MRRESALRSVEGWEVVVFACGLAGHQRAYVADGLRRRADVRFVESFEALDRLLPTASRCDALVVAPADQRRRSAVATVERVAREWPETAIVVFCPHDREQPPSLRALLLAGAHEFVFEGMHDTASKLALAVENGRRECAAEGVFREIHDIIPPELQTSAQTVLARPDLTSVEQLASAMGVHRKTLVNRCARSGFLQPAELIVWCRLASVGHMLEHSGATIESIALTLGYPSHTSLRNMIKRHTGRTATEIRHEGGLAAVLKALRKRLLPIA